MLVYLCFLHSFILFTFFAVGPRGWKVIVESPDQMASMTSTNIFSENAQVQEWARELKKFLVERTGLPFGKMTTCFFSDCCGYEYAHKSVRPTKIPPVLRRMMRVLMPHCGLKSESRWPTGINVNYYPNG